MTDVTEDICAATNEELVTEVLRYDYGFVNGKIRKLDGYDDRNYHVTEVNECIEGIEFPVDGIVIKFVNSIDAKNTSLLEAQIKLTQHLATSGIYAPIPVLNKYGKGFRSLVIDNKSHAVIVYKYIEGETMNKIKLTSEITTDFGSFIGHLTLTLKEFNHEGFHRDCHLWSLEKSPDVLKFVNVFDQENQRQIVITILNKFQSDVLLKSEHLEKSVIHGDLNVNNMIIKDNKIFGVIDMGDAVYSFTIFDFAIALCYLILHCFEDIDANLSDVQIKTFVDAYEKQYRCLNDLELRMIYTCVCARICQSLVLGKKSSLRDLSNLYIMSTQKNGWRMLEALISVQEDGFIKLLGH